jgi:hypothetical protein
MSKFTGSDDPNYHKLKTEIQTAARSVKKRQEALRSGRLSPKDLIGECELSRFDIHQGVVSHCTSRNISTGKTVSIQPWRGHVNGSSTLGPIKIGKSGRRRLRVKRVFFG